MIRNDRGIVSVPSCRREMPRSKVKLSSRVAMRERMIAPAMMATTITKKIAWLLRLDAEDIFWPLYIG